MEVCFAQVSLSFRVLDKLVTQGKGKHERTVKPCFTDSDTFFSTSVSRLRQICLMETYFLCLSFLTFKKKILSIFKWSETVIIITIDNTILKIKSGSSERS